MSKFKPSRRGQINVVLNGLVSSGVVAGFRTNYETREEPDPLRITVTRADGASAAAVQAKVLKALGQVGEGAKIIVELGDSQSQTEHLGAESEITGEQIRAARKLLGWHRSMVANKARGITGNTVGKAEGTFPGKPPTDEQLAEIKRTLVAAGIEFTSEGGVTLKSTKARKGK